MGRFAVIAAAVAGFGAAVLWIPAGARAENAATAQAQPGSGPNIQRQELKVEGKSGSKKATRKRKTEGKIVGPRGKPRGPDSDR